MEKLAVFFRYTALFALLTVGILVFCFAFMSGAETENSIVIGILKNSPNALPWLAILVLTWLAWKYELMGGILITQLGGFLVYFFNFSGPNFFLSTFFLTLLITILGLFFVASWVIRKHLSQLNKRNLRQDPNSARVAD